MIEYYTPTLEECVEIAMRCGVRNPDVARIQVQREAGLWQYLTRASVAWMREKLPFIPEREQSAHKST